MVGRCIATAVQIAAVEVTAVGRCMATAVEYTAVEITVEVTVEVETVVQR